MIITELRKNIFRHILFCSLFLIIPIVLSSRPQGEPFLTITKPFIRDIIGNFLLLVFFYINYYILVSKYYFNKQYLIYVVLVLLALAVIFMLPSLLTGRFTAGPQEPPPPLKPAPLYPLSAKEPGIYFSLFNELKHHFYLFFIALFFSFLLRTSVQMAEIREEKLKAELSSLKSQINPHFLFNTLNSIYALSVKKDSRASAAIVNLSGLMRYVIKDANDNRIPLQREIDYISNYIELQKARLGNTAYIKFETSGATGSKEIAPLILITYIENAFKYGINPDVDDCVVDVKILVTDNGLTLFVFNKKVPLAEEIESTGIGIPNTAERLKLLYPNKHEVEIKENDETYSVTLSLELI